MDYSTKTRDELIAICKENKIKGYSGKNKDGLRLLITQNCITAEQPVIDTIVSATGASATGASATGASATGARSFKMIDLCAGTGAFTRAFANNVDCVFANDMVEWSKIIYDENFNHKLTLSDLNKLTADKLPSHDILTAGFPCFVEGTSILTYTGYKPIESVDINDKLLTHTGQFQRILNLQQKKYTGDLYEVKIKYHPNAIVCTEEHPFYVREKKKKWNNLIRRNNYSFDKPTWKKANELSRNDYFGMVINTKEIIPEFTFEKKVNKYTIESIHIKLDKLDYWFVMGYLVGDGWVEDAKKKDGRCAHKICFAINNKDNDEVFEKINKVIPITDKHCDGVNKDNIVTCKKYGSSNFVWHSIFKKFGKYAHNKLIPEWVQDAPKEFIQEFINGYMKADGCITNGKLLQITTVSYNLAFGLQRLYLKLGHIFSINKCIRPKTCIILGRVVNQRDTYCIRGVLTRQRNVSSFIEDNYVWFAPFKITKTEVTDIPVYNFEVERDNSYIVENTIVHNCQPFSIAGQQEGFQDERSNVFWKILEILDLHKPQCVILENVKNLVSHDSGRTFEIIKTKLSERDYHIRFKVLNTSVITGIPQNRERIYIVCLKSKAVFDKFTLDFPPIAKASISSLLEASVPDKYYYTDKSSTWDLVKASVIKKDTVYQYRRVYVRENKSNECPTLTANMGSGGHNVPLVLDDKGIRKLTPRECFNFQGFPKTYKLPGKLSDANLYKLAGNAVSLPVVELIARRLMPLLKEAQA